MLAIKEGDRRRGCHRRRREPGQLVHTRRFECQLSSGLADGPHLGVDRQGVAEVLPQLGGQFRIVGKPLQDALWNDGAGRYHGWPPLNG